jgi:hypothetical protein
MTRLSRNSREIENSLSFYSRLSCAAFFFHSTLKKSDDVIDYIARDAYLNSLRVNMRVVFDIVFLRALFACD